VFYAVGFNSISYITGIFVADTTSLLNRQIVDGLKSTPYIATTFAGPAIAQRFYEESTYQWAFGAFAIITPFIALPTILMFTINAKKAEKMGLLTSRTSDRTWKESVLHYCKEFDGKSCPALEDESTDHGSHWMLFDCCRFRSRSVAVEPGCKLTR
jgi:hypothetical protein